MPTLADLVTQSLTRRLSGVKPAQTKDIISGVIEDLGDAASQDVTDHIAAVETPAEKLAKSCAHIPPILSDGRPNPAYLALSDAHKIASTESALAKSAVASTAVPWKSLRS
jgi:hypothetical protein